jgi:hypothetical protein
VNSLRERIDPEKKAPKAGGDYFLGRIRRVERIESTPKQKRKPKGGKFAAPRRTDVIGSEN